MSVDITITGGADAFKTMVQVPLAARHLVREFLDDIADELLVVASEEAPMMDPADVGPGDIPGRLKEHPFDRRDLFGEAAEIRGEAEGFRSVRGAGGRFIPGKASLGNVFAETEITLPESLPYAKYVHRGTGIYGPYATPIVSPTGRMMKFIYQRKNWRAFSVKGQQANPYLERAFDRVNRAFVPIKFEELKAQIKLIT